MDHRLALLHQAMGESIPCPHQPGAPTPDSVALTANPPPRHLTLVGLTCVTGLAFMLWVSLQEDRSALHAAPVATTAAAPATEHIDPPAPAAEASHPGRTDEDEARAVVEAWRLAWSRSDVNAYLGHYSARFVPVNGQSPAQWAASRRKVIGASADIQVSTHDLRIQRIDDRSMNVSFLQDYAAGNYRETAQPKVLRLSREDTGWRIVSEQSLPAGAALTP